MKISSCAPRRSKIASILVRRFVCGAKRRYEDEPFHRPDRRWLVHIDPRVEKELDDGRMAAEHGKLQESRGMRRRPKDVGAPFNESTQRRHIPAPSKGQRLDWPAYNASTFRAIASAAGMAQLPR